MKYLCIYGAASMHILKKYIKAGEKLGEKIADAGYGLVYGGGGTGMMGAVARGVRSRNGEVIAVVPSFMNEFETLFNDYTKRIETKTMIARKNKMEDTCEGFFVCPGGIGTLDEFFQIMTLKELRQKVKPIVFLNTDGFYDKLFELMEDLEQKKFLRPGTLNLYRVAKTPDEAMKMMKEELDRRETRLL